MFCLLSTTTFWGNLIQDYNNKGNKINLTFYSYVKSQTRVLNVGLERIGLKELMYKVVTSIFLVAYMKKRKTYKVLYTL